MSKTIDIPKADLVIVLDILRTYLPPQTQVWVFGSRATATARQYSDLDLAIEGPRAVGIDLLGQIADAMSESELPFKVDVIDLKTVDLAFRRIIEQDMISLPFRADG